MERVRISMYLLCDRDPIQPITITVQMRLERAWFRSRPLLGTHCLLAASEKPEGHAPTAPLLVADGADCYPEAKSKTLLPAAAAPRCSQCPGPALFKLSANPRPLYREKKEKSELSVAATPPPRELASNERLLCTPRLFWAL